MEEWLVLFYNCKNFGSSHRIIYLEGYVILILFLTPTNHFRDYNCCFLKLNIITVFRAIFYEIPIYLVFPFDINFYKIINPRRAAIIDCNQFVRNKIGKDVIVPLKIETCLLTILLLNKVSHFTDLI